MSEHAPSVAEIREYVETGGEPRPWVELDEAEEARERFRGEAFDRMIKAVRADQREKDAQIAEDSYEDQPTWLRNGIAARIREQK